MEQRKKVLFVHPNLVARGAEKVLVDLLNELDQSKLDITLFTFFKEGVHGERLSTKIKRKYIFDTTFRGWSIIQKVFSRKLLYKLCVKEKYDVIVAYLEGVPTRMISGCTEPSTKLYAWVHVDLTNYGIEKVFRGDDEMKACYHRMDKVIGVSRHATQMAKQKMDLPDHKMQVIHNVLDTDDVISKGRETVQEITFSKEVLNLCSVGSLTRQKGYKRLLKVIHKISEDYKNFHLYLVGNGDEKKFLEEYIEDHQLGACVTLLGFQSNPHKFVANCDLFVCSSFEEGFSTAVTESVLLETPVITTDCSGMDEILEDGKYGLIVKNSEEALYQGLLSMISNPKIIKEYKEKAIERSQYFQTKNNAKDVEKLLEV